ncbi:MAG: hypothetical protein IPN17_37080 [Deltaproteobacteria bacterium]|nr:hypothetical protein [Deltaproteobacteria bacterium]MBK7065873.1 hypothetical protein [Deltaproteobacteria bacterium]MBK8697718.1 hypothetical protein [Deltaproteobacteria bacterium]MBP6833285.1 hypothetical protein [Deltaproteobacteria bacterium]
MKHLTPRRSAMFGLGAVALASSLAAADPPPNGGPRHGPPQVAFDACANRTAGAACRVLTPFGELHGTCTTVPERGLACRPDGRAPGGGPPPRR